MFQKEFMFIQQGVKLLKMLNNKEKKFLKKYSLENNILKINIGKDLIDENQINNINNALKAHEIIKISLLNNSFENKEDKNKIFVNLSEALKYEIIEKIGNTLLVYKQNLELKNHIVIPKNL